MEEEVVEEVHVFSMGDITPIIILVNIVENLIWNVYNYIFLERLYYEEVKFDKIR